MRVAVFDGENLSMSVFDWLYPTPEEQAAVPAKRHQSARTHRDERGHKGTVTCMETSSDECYAAVLEMISILCASIMNNFIGCAMGVSLHTYYPAHGTRANMHSI